VSPANIKILGVRGENLPPKRARAVLPADFQIAAIIGRFERKFDKAFAVRDPADAIAIFGDHAISAFYGWDGVNGFFQNLAGAAATLYIVSHVGFDTGAIDAVVATVSLDDQGSSPEPTLKLEAAYQEELEYGTSGNRTGYMVTNGSRFATALAEIVSAGAYTAKVDSVAGIKVGDVVHFDGTAYDEHHKITAIDEATGYVTWTDAVWGAGAGVIDDPVLVLGFRLRAFRRSATGIVTEVESELGLVWCTMEPEVSDFYVQNVHASNRYLKASDLASTNSPEETIPVEVATVAYLASGDDGTVPTTAAHWARTLTRLDNLPVRIIANADTTLEAVQKAGETYCKGRWDNPKWLYNIQSDQSKAQLLTIGASYQRSDDVLGVIMANWLGVSDPFTVSPIAPDREVPCVGHIAGLWVRVIAQLGIHFIPSLRSTPLYGVNSVVGEQFLDDGDRTDLARLGVNVIQELAGVGVVARNFFTPSQNLAYQFANGPLMREYIKISGTDSLQISENTPNSIERIREDGSALQRFMHNLWENGNTGSARTGETFGQGFDEEGNPAPEEAHYEVVANEINNTQATINAGERYIDVYFTFPTPAGTIRLRVGILLR